MIVAALVVFAVLLVAWLMAPGNRPVATVGEALPVSEPIAEAA